MKSTLSSPTAARNLRFLPRRGFLQQRQQQALCGASLGEAWLFFGCRGPAEDYLYGADWDAFLADGTLSRLETAFSRQQVSMLTEAADHTQCLFSMQYHLTSVTGPICDISRMLRRCASYHSRCAGWR